MKTQSGLGLALLPLVFGLVTACGASSGRPGAPGLPSDPPDAKADETPPVEVGARPYLVDIPQPSEVSSAGGVADDETVASPSALDPGTGGAAGAGGADGAAGSGTPDSLAATEPRIVSVSPESGAAAVMADARIVIEFSQAMNEAQTQRAWQSDSLPRDQVDFAWNDAGTVLTVTPRHPLAYAHASLNDSEHLELRAQTYEYTFSGAASDRSGHALAATDVSFSTMREIMHTLHSVAELTGIVADPEHPQLLTGFVTVDLGPLPPGIRALQRATVRTSEYQLFAPVTVSQVAFARLDASALLAESRGTVTTLPTGTSGPLPVPESLWHFLATDYLARSGARSYSQYRFDLPSGTDANIAEKLLEAGSLELDYLVP